MTKNKNSSNLVTVPPVKEYILTLKLRVNDNDIQVARAWEKKNKLGYKDNIAHLLHDCLTDGGNIHAEIIETEIEEE